MQLNHSELEETGDSTQKQPPLASLTRRLWAKWRENYQSHLDHKMTIEEHEELLRQAQALIDTHGLPSSRIFSLVCRVKTAVNSVNDWRSRVHEVIRSGEFHSTEQLNRILRSFPDTVPRCSDYSVFEKLIRGKSSLERQIENAFRRSERLSRSVNSFSSVSFMRQLLARAQKFDLVVGKLEKLQKKIELATLVFEKLAIMREPFSPATVLPKSGLFCRNTRVWKSWRTSTTW